MYCKKTSILQLKGGQKYKKNPPDYKVVQRKYQVVMEILGGAEKLRIGGAVPF